MRANVSGSVAVPGARARVARASRIYVEGRHDAELIAQVWGEDLRIEGVVVEHLGGIDDLVDVVAEFGPGSGRRLGVLVDHLVAGSNEARIADAVRRGPGGPDTPGRRSPLCRYLAGREAAAAGPDIARAWRRIRSWVRDWNDLEPADITA